MSKAVSRVPNAAPAKSDSSAGESEAPVAAAVSKSSGRWKERESSDIVMEDAIDDEDDGDAPVLLSKARPPARYRRASRSPSPQSNESHCQMSTEFDPQQSPRVSDDEYSGDEAVDATDITKLSAMGLVAKAPSVPPVMPRDKWESRLKFEEDGFVIDMQDMELCEDNMAVFCIWLQKRVGSDSPIAKSIDLSGNQIDSKCVGSLMTMLQSINAKCVVLNLQRNIICDEGVKMIAKYLTSYSEASVYELHLSENRITKWGVMWLLVCLALHPGYPIRDNEGTYNPMWLLLDNNDMTTQDAEEILKSAKDGLAISLCDAIGCTISQCSKSYLGTRRKPNCVAHMVNFFEQTGPPVFFPLEVQDPDYHGHVIFYNFPTLDNIQLCKRKRSEPEIVWEDDDNMVVMKPANWLCHSTNRTARSVDDLLDQVTHASLHHYLELLYPNAPAIRRTDCQNGLCHRLDRETSGFVICCKTWRGYRNIKDQIYKHELIKDYIALVHGQMEDQNGVCKARIDDSSYKHGRNGAPRRVWVTENPKKGIEAITLFETLRHYEGPDGKPYTLCHFRLVTGRTHQIRVHMSYLGHPLVSDSIYCEPEVYREDLKVCPRVFLHKLRAAFFNTEKVPQVLWAPLQMVPDLCDTLLNLKEVNP